MTYASAGAMPDGISRLSATLRHDLLPILGRLPAYGRLMYSLVMEGSLSGREKAPLFIALGYQVSPIDLIPGFIPVIGQLDDLLVMLWGICHTLDMLPPEIATARLESVQLTREQIEHDMAVARRTFGELLATGAHTAGKGLVMLLKAGVLAGAFVGYFTYYLMRGRRGK